jgi:hypothetical protein
VGKAAIYRRWASKDALALDILLELAERLATAPETGETREGRVGVPPPTWRTLGCVAGPWVIGGSQSGAAAGRLP